MSQLCERPDNHILDQTSVSLWSLLRLFLCRCAREYVVPTSLGMGDHYHGQSVHLLFTAHYLLLQRIDFIFTAQRLGCTVQRLVISQHIPSSPRFLPSLAYFASSRAFLTAYSRNSRIREQETGLRGTRGTRTRDSAPGHERLSFLIWRLRQCPIKYVGVCIYL